jgi:hypothetical protein
MSEITALRAEQEEPSAAVDEVETAFPPDVIAKLKSQFPSTELRQYRSEEGDAIVCKCPSRGDYKRFRAMIVDPNQRANALETLMRSCVVYPDAQGVAVLLERRPGLAEVFGDKLSGWAGAGQEVTEKKL